MPILADIKLRQVHWPPMDFNGQLRRTTPSQLDGEYFGKPLSATVFPCLFPPLFFVAGWFGC